MKKKSLFLLPCIVAVAIATSVGTKIIKSNANESNNLLIQNVEALSSGVDAGSTTKHPCNHSITTSSKGTTVRYCADCTPHDGEPDGGDDECWLSVAE